MSITKKIMVGIVLLIALFIMFFTRFYSSRGIGGDQVHYLVMTQSLLEDGDFDLKNDYQLKRYKTYYPDELDAHIPPTQFTKDSPRWYSLHNPGLPILIAPFVKFFGYKSTFVVMVLVAFITLLLAYEWSKKVTKNVKASIFATAILFTSVFYLSLVGYIFPNFLISALFLGALLLLEKKDRSSWHLILFGLILGIGPWIHVKIILSFGTIGVIAIGQIILAKEKSWQKRTKEIFALAIPAIILMGLFEWKLYEWYGVFLPNQTFAGDIMFFVSPLKSLPAILFDSTKGLFTNNPALLLIILGLPVWAVKKTGQFVRLLIVLVPSFILQLTFLDWWGGWSPSGRYIMDMIPILLPAVACVFLFWKHILIKIFTVVLIGIQLVFSFIYIFSKVTWVWAGERNPIFLKLESYTGFSFDALIPQFKPELILRPGGQKFLSIFVAATLICLILGVFLSRKSRAIH